MSTVQTKDLEQRNKEIGLGLGAIGGLLQAGHGVTGVQGLCGWALTSGSCRQGSTAPREG